MYCPSCGGEITEQSTFCSHCGDDVSAIVEDGGTERTAAQSDCGNTRRQTEPEREGSSQRASQRTPNDNSIHRRQTGVEGINENVAAALSYAFGFVSGMVIYAIEEENAYVRFHAAQSVIVFGALIPLTMAIGMGQFFIGMMPIIGTPLAIGIAIISSMIGPITVVLWVLLIYKAYQGIQFRLPILGKMAERFV